MNVADFDAWRKRYNDMTYQDMKDFYNAVEIDHPLQQAYDAHVISQFLDNAIASVGAITVLEIGGWKGELAKQMLIKPNILKWFNFEICERAVAQSVITSKKYHAFIPDDFVWNISLPCANVFVAAHFVEHIRWRELEELFANLPPDEIQFIGLQAPIQETEINWIGYHGSHILEVGWKRVSACLLAKGFAELSHLQTDDFRAFNKR